MAGDDVRTVLGRRPPKGQAAFGHVDLSEKARAELAVIARDLRAKCESAEEIAFHPEDRAEEGEVLVGELEGFDSYYQPKAVWSLERMVAAIRGSGIPEPLGKEEIVDGRWSFYGLRLTDGDGDVVVVRAHAPTRGLKSHGKVLTKLVGTELRPVEDPLLSFDFDGEVVVIDQKVYVLRPDQTERLFVDAEEVKRRAPETVERFAKDLGAALSEDTVLAVERVCSHNAFTARRVERLIGENILGSVTAKELREGLVDARLPTGAFATEGAISAESDLLAKALVDITADLYYQPRFAGPSRRVGSWRIVK
jgi:hypothetical protein